MPGAKCHPNRKHAAHGLCSACYERLPKRLARLKSPSHKAALMRAKLVYRKTTKGKISLRRTELKRRYGITIEEVNDLLIGQDYCCAICDDPIDYTIGKPIAVVDHDHVTGRVRGLLCRRCNIGLGYMEKFEWMDKARIYLGG